MPEKLLCPIRPNAAFFDVLSPRVGTIQLREKNGTFITENTEIGELVSLGRHFILVVSLSGKIRNSLGRILSVGYGDIIFSLEVAYSGDEKPMVQESATIDATMDGLLYLSSTPHSPPFVTVGDEIVPGQTIGLIEVMKCFYPMKYQGSIPVKVLGVLVANRTSVGCGTKIYRVE